MINVNKIAKNILKSEGCHFVGKNDKGYDVYQNEEIRLRMIWEDGFMLNFISEDNVYGQDRNRGAISKKKWNIDECNKKIYIKSNFIYKLGDEYYVHIFLQEEDDREFLLMHIACGPCWCLRTEITLSYEDDIPYILISTTRITKEEKKINLGECSVDFIINMLYEIIASEITDKSRFDKFDKLFNITKSALTEGIGNLIKKWMNRVSIECVSEAIKTKIKINPDINE